MFNNSAKVINFVIINHKNRAMKYLIRSVKYLLYFALLFCIITLIIALLMNHDITHFSGLFVEGALWKIIGVFVLVSAVYPLFGFKKNHLVIDGEFANYRDIIVETMQAAYYKLVEETSSKLVFRTVKTAVKFSRMWEDAVTYELKDNNELVVDGPYKDTLRFIRTISYRYRMNQQKEEE